MSLSARPLTNVTLLAYALPWAVYMAISLPISTWFGKHATDTLLIPAAAMGSIVMLARAWDAVSDPLAGTLSDRTRSRFGRRRVWMLTSLLPVAATLVALWSPPAGLDATAMLLWLAVSYIAWETASTMLLVPYQALGNELTTDYHERTRLFGWRHMVSVGGYGLGLGLIYLLSSSAEGSVDGARQTALLVAIGSGGVLIVVVAAAVARLPEPAHHQGRSALNMRKAIAGVLRNPHARILIVVAGVESFAMGSIGFMAPYVVDDVLGRASLLVPVLACWMLPQFAFTALWMRLARTVGKKPLLLCGMAIYTLGFVVNGGISPERWWVMIAGVLLVGTGGGVVNVLAPSILADVIDYDEFVTGERNEGAYTASWNLLRKLGYALASGVGGLALGAAGYDGAIEEQNAAVRTVLILWVSALPALVYGVAGLMFSRFQLNELEHAELRRELDARGGRERGDG